MGKPFFSIVAPFHNSEAWMAKGLDSVFSQTFEDFELIGVLDACTDGSEKVLNAYTAFTHHKKLITEYGRAGLARNDGMDAAEGEWVLFMDDDDWWIGDDAFEKIARWIRRTEETGIPMDILAFGFEWKGVGPKFNTPQHAWTAIWNKAYRREFLQKCGVRFPDWKHSDDDWFTRYVMPRAEVQYMNDVLYYYNFMREGSLTWKIEKGLLDPTIPARPEPPKK